MYSREEMWGESGDDVYAKRRACVRELNFIRNAHASQVNLNDSSGREKTFLSYGHYFIVSYDAIL